jgi:endoglucanase
MLAWGALHYGDELAVAGELDNVRDAIRWGTDYFMKASAIQNQLWVQVGDPIADHSCWQNPETMDTPRTLYKIDRSTPGTEIAAETAAALAASSIVFVAIDNTYSHLLLHRAKSLFGFADQYRGTYDGECPFYCSYSGYHDELAWAASWLYKATRSPKYSQYILQQNFCTGNVSEFSWDLKSAGVQILLSNLYFSGESNFEVYRRQAEMFFCSAIPYSPHFKHSMTPGGLLYVRDGANTQYATSTSFLLLVYSDLLSSHNQSLQCDYQIYESGDLIAFAKQQVHYILGWNPLGMSFMVGFGDRYPHQAHHRGSSIVSIYEEATKISCAEGFMFWFRRQAPNPNELTGAVVGGPDRYERFEDWRADSGKLEPTTYINAPLVGVLAKLHSISMESPIST